MTLWGGIYPGAKLALREMPVLSFTYLRILLAMIVLFVASGSAQRLRVPRVLWRPLLQAGLAQTVFQFFLVAGLQQTTAGNSAILLATAPLLTTGWLALVQREHLASRQWFGLVIGFVGVALVVQARSLDVTGSSLSGNLLALGAAAAWAWYGVVIGRLVGTLGTLRATGWTMVIAAMFFTALSFTEMRAQAWENVSWQAWAGLIYGATVGMVVAMALWGRSIHRFGPQQTMLYVYLEPVSAVTIAAVVLGEVLRPDQAVGALLAFVGVGLGSTRELVEPRSPNDGIGPTR